MAPKSQFASPVARRILQRVTALIQGGTPPRVARVVLGRPNVDLTKTTVSGPDRAMQVQHARQIANTLAYERTRRARYADYREMDAQVPELHRALMVLVDFIFGGKIDDGGTRVSFEVNTEKARPEVAKVIEDTTDILDLQRTIRDITREGIELGDSFTRFIYTQSALVGQIPLIPEDVEPMEIYGFVDRYVLSGSGGDFSGTGGGDLYPYEVLHYAPDRPRGARFGTSLWSSATKRWRIAEAVEDVLGVMALIEPRGRRRVFWPFPASGKAGADAAIWEWVRKIQAETEEDYFFDADGKLQKSVVPQLETADRFFPFKVWGEGMEGSKPFVVESPPADLKQLVDVLRFFQDSYFIATGVPAALCGYEANVNARSTVEQQGIHFALTVRNRQAQVAALLQDIYIRALLAAGIVPEKNEVQIVMPPPSNFDQEVKARVLQQRALAASQMASAGFPLSFVLRKTFDLSDSEAEAVLATADLPDVSAAPAPTPPNEPKDVAMESQVVRILTAVERVYLEMGAVRRDITEIRSP